MSKKQSDPRGKQQGAQQHAEGQHGEKTQDRLRKEIQAAGTAQRADREQHDEQQRTEHPTDGEHRLFERREQHDEAEVNSEKNRLDRDIDRHGHNRANFQVRGGAASHPALPDESIDPANPDSGRR